MSQQIYACIKRTSKYFGQGERGKLFPVDIARDGSGYVVKGGVGGQYRMRDVALYVIADGEAIKLA